MKIFSTVLKSGHDFRRKISKGHNSVKMYVEFRFFFSAHRQMVVFICTKFHQNIIYIYYRAVTILIKKNFQRAIIIIP